MEIKILSKDWWNKRYKTGDTGWDIGYVSTPIKEYIDKLPDKSLYILIPGCGNSYEAEYLYRNGFKNTYLIDLSPLSLDNFKKRVPDFPKTQLICGDFFKHKGQYDLIIEQTFFCAIDPILRKRYAKKIHILLKSRGRLVGLLFNSELNTDHPPFGGSREEYIPYFEPYFDFHTFEIAYNSILPRKERELFINLQKKNT